MASHILNVVSLDNVQFSARVRKILEGTLPREDFGADLRDYALARNRFKQRQLPEAIELGKKNLHLQVAQRQVPAWEKRLSRLVEGEARLKRLFGE